MKSETFEMAVVEIVWLITLLTNQNILIYNLKNKGERTDRRLVHPLILM